MRVGLRRPTNQPIATAPTAATTTNAHLTLALAPVQPPDNLLENVAARGAQLRAGLEAIQTEHPGWVKDIRGWGLITGLEINDDQGVTAGEVSHTQSHVVTRSHMQSHVVMRSHT